MVNFLRLKLFFCPGIKDALYQEDGEYRCVGARGPDLMRLRELKRVTLKVTGELDLLFQLSFWLVIPVDLMLITEQPLHEIQVFQLITFLYYHSP